MAKNRRRHTGIPGIDSFQDQEEQQTAQDRLRQKRVADQLDIPAESVEISTSISKSINDKVRYLMAHHKGLKEFYLSSGKNPDYIEFFGNNREAIEKLLKTEINQTYKEAIRNFNRRESFYTDMVEKGAITGEELATLKEGILSFKPYRALVKKISKDTTRAVPLTSDDLEKLDNATVSGSQFSIIDNFQRLLEQLKTENKLTEDDLTELNRLGPKTDQQLIQAREEINKKIAKHAADVGDPNINKVYAEIIQKEEEINQKFDQYTDDYNTLVKGLGEQIQSMVDQEQTDKNRKKQIKLLRDQTGLPIREGQVLWGVERKTNGTAGEKNNRIEIKTIGFDGTAELGPEDDVDPSFQSYQPTLEPVITFSSLAQDGSGTSIERKMTASNFMKWLVANQVSEKFETVQELETALDLPGLIKQGQSFECLEPVKANSNGPEAGVNDLEMKPRTVTIQKIENGKIYLDQEVLLESATQGRGPNNLKTSELDFGQFARWYRKTSAVPEISDLRQLDNLLGLHHKKLMEEIGRNEDPGEPICFSGADYPFYLISAYDPDMTPVQITGVKDGMIEDDQGGKIPPHQFLREVRESGLTPATPEDLETMREIAENQRKPERAELLKDMEKQLKEKGGGKGYSNKEGKVKPLKKKGYWKTLWENTSFLSLIELYEIFIHAPMDRIKHKLKENSEKRVAQRGKDIWRGFPNLGVGLSDLSLGFEDKLNSKISGEVKEVKEALEKNFPDSAEVFKLLYSAPSKVVARACLQHLAEKGMLRWEDDTKLWAALNSLFPGTPYPFHYHELVGGDNVQIILGDDTPKRVPRIDIREQIRCMLDKNYSPGTFESLDRANEGKYKEEKQKTSDNMHRYEYLQGGITTMLQSMIDDWEQGKSVKPHEFDGLLSQAILKNEFSFEQGILMMISAFAIRNPKGQTLLTYSRLNSFIGTMNNHLMFFYFADKQSLVDQEGNIIYGEDGKPKRGHMTLNHFRKIYNNVIKKDIDENTRQGKRGFSKYTAGKNTIEWIQKEMLNSSLVKKKLSQRGGSADVDIGLYHYIGPNMRQENLDRVLSMRYGSLQSNEALKNMYAGYNSQLIIKSNSLNPGNIEDFGHMINSYVYFNNILRNRIKVGDTNYIRFDDFAYESCPLADKEKSTKLYCEELEKFMIAYAQGLARQSGDQELERLTRVVLESAPGPVPDDQEKAFRDRIYKATKELAKQDPAGLSDIARRAAAYMTGITGAQRSAAEFKEIQEAQAS